MEFASRCEAFVKLLPRDACFDVLLFGYFLLHEQEKATRSPDASGNAQDASTILASYGEWKLCYPRRETARNFAKERAPR
jgi:hypothetical protein